MNTAAVYIRVSTDDQTDYSPDAQKRLLFAYAKQHDFIIAEQHIYIDEGISGRRADKRPEFMHMIKDAKQKPRPFDVILVHKFDRFSRSREDSILYKSLLKRECGIRVISITEQIEDDKFSVILEAILEAMAEYYSLNLSDEVLKGMTEKAIKGGYQAAPPLGYSIPHHKALPTIVESEALIVRKIFSDYINNHHSSYQIAKDLNRLLLVTKHGKPFEKRTVEYILKNPFYAGYIRFRIHGDKNQSILSKGMHEPIISEETFKAVQSSFLVKKRFSKEHDPDSKHLLSGLVKCSNCGSSLLVFKRVLANSQSTYYNLQCCGYQKGKCLISHQLSEKKMLSTMYASILSIYPPNSNIYHRFMHHMHKISVDNTYYEDNIHKIERKLKRIKEAYLLGVDTLEEYTLTKNALISQLDIIKEAQHAAQSTNEIPDQDILYPSIASLLQSDLITNSEKRNILTTLFHHIEYDKPNEILRFYYNPINNVEFTPHLQ